jgi:innexin
MQRADARGLRSMNTGERRAEMNKLTTYVNECLDISAGRRAPQQIFCIRIGRNLGSYVATLYLFVKLLYLCNVIGQFFMLNSFIGRGRPIPVVSSCCKKSILLDYTLWGFKAMTSLWTGEGWNDSPVFPRVSLCDFRGYYRI